MNAKTNTVTNRVPVTRALKMRVERGMSYGDIASHFKVSKTSVFNVLKPILNLIESPEVAQAYHNNRSDILNNLECKLACELANPDKLKSASLNNVAYSFNTISNARRLERDQSTSNVKFADVSDAIETARAKRQALAEQLAELEGDDEG